MNILALGENVSEERKEELHLDAIKNVTENYSVEELEVVCRVIAETHPELMARALLNEHLYLKKTVEVVAQGISRKETI